MKIQSHLESEQKIYIKEETLTAFIYIEAIKMGFKKQKLSVEEDSTMQSMQSPISRNYQNYYSEMYDECIKTAVQEGQSKKQAEKVLSSIFSRTKLPTKTQSSSTLALIDIDKLISINEGSLKENGEEVKYMRMVASLKHQNARLSERDNNLENENQGGNVPNTNLRQLHNLVRMARLHYMSRNRPPQGDDMSQDSQDQSEGENLGDERAEQLRRIAQR